MKQHPFSFFNSSDLKISSAELMVLLICSLSVHHLSICRPSTVALNCYSSFSSSSFTGETRHTVPPCNKVRISILLLELLEFQEFQISLKRNSYSSRLFDHSEFFSGETRHIGLMPPCNKDGILNFHLEFRKFQEFQISLKHYSSFSYFLIILNFLLDKLGI